MPPTRSCAKKTRGGLSNFEMSACRTSPSWERGYSSHGGTLPVSFQDQSGQPGCGGLPGSHLPLRPSCWHLPLGPACHEVVGSLHTPARGRAYNAAVEDASRGLPETPPLQTYEAGELSSYCVSSSGCTVSASATASRFANTTVTRAVADRVDRCLFHRA